MEAFDLLQALGVMAVVFLKDGTVFEGALRDNGDGTYSVPSGYRRMDARRFTAAEVEAIKLF